MDYKQLVSDCINNSRKAQRELFDMYYDKMIRVCLFYAKDRLEAETIVVEGFLEVYKSLHTYKGTSDLFYWIKSIMLRRCMKYLRLKYNNKIDYTNFEDNEFANSLDNSPNIIDELSANELLSYIQKLPDTEKVVFNLFVLEDYAHKEIAAELNIAESTSRWYLMNAKNILKKQIEHNEPIKKGVGNE